MVQGGGNIPIIVIALPLLLSAVSIDFFTGEPVIGFMKMCCTIVPCPGSVFVFGCGTWFIGRCGWRSFDPERGRPRTLSW